MAKIVKESVKNAKRIILFNVFLVKYVIGISILRDIIAAIWIVTIAFLSLTNFVNHTMIRLTNNIEIIAPYVTDEEYKYLKSDFTLMKNYNDFCELTNALNKYASDNNVILK